MGDLGPSRCRLFTALLEAQGERKAMSLCSWDMENFLLLIQKFCGWSTVNTVAVDNEAKQTIEALQNELQKTKEKLLAVELKKQSTNAGTLVDSYVAGKIKQLKEQIATLEKREERYKTVFADRISVFRRACCELFGYKIVMDDHQRSDGMLVTHFILHSIYAMNDVEKLEFEYESGNANLIVEMFIRKMNSIPAFISNVTLESFNKRTFVKCGTGFAFDHALSMLTDASHY